MSHSHSLASYAPNSRLLNWLTSDLSLTSQDISHGRLTSLAKMSSDCKASAQHQLCITLSLKGILTIEFPHEEWAITFRDFVLQSPDAKNRMWNPYISDRDSSHGCYVRMNLQGTVNRVQFLGTDEYGGSVIFVFKDVSTAQEWRKCSGLWLDAGGDKLKLPSRWSHEKFERIMKLSKEGEKGSESEKGDEREKENEGEKGKEVANDTLVGVHVASNAIVIGREKGNEGETYRYEGKDVVKTSSRSGAKLSPRGLPFI